MHVGEKPRGEVTLLNLIVMTMERLYIQSCTCKSTIYTCVMHIRIPVKLMTSLYTLNKLSQRVP